MKYALYAIGALVVVIAITALIGAMLPVKHRATRRARFRITPAALYDEIASRRDPAYEVVEASPPARYRTRVTGQNLPYGGTWTFDISPVEGGGAELRITEDGEVYNPVFRFVSRFVMGHDATIETYFRDLGRKLGQPVRTEA